MVVLQGRVCIIQRQFCGRQRNVRTGNDQGIHKLENGVVFGDWGATLAHGPPMAELFIDMHEKFLKR